MRTALAPLAGLLLAAIAALSLSARAEGDAGTPDAGAAPARGDAGSPDAGSPDAGSDAGVSLIELPPPRPLPPIPAGLGRVAGRITLSGPAPAPRPAVSVGREPPPGAAGPAGSAGAGGPGGLAPAVSSKDTHVCGLTQPDLSLQLGLKGGVLETVLWAEDGPPPAKGPRPEVRMAVEGCRFIPHVLVATEGSELLLVNRDPLYHNVTGTGLASFSYALVLKDHDIPMKLKKPGVLALESKTRAWMRGYVQSLPTTAWAMTDTDGSYFLDLPPGKHTIKLWHERLGEREETVDVAANETTLKDFALTPK